MKSTKPTGIKKRRPRSKRKRVVRETANEYCILNATEEHVVRRNAFGIEETLDRKSYMEALDAEKQLNDMLENFLNNTQPTRSMQKLKKVELKKVKRVKKSVQ